MGTRPLVLLTRPEDRSAPLAAALNKAGADTIVWPLLTIHSSLSEHTAFPAAQAVLLTSARAAEAMRSRIEAPAYCVGGATAKAARKAGFAEVHDADGDADALAALVSQKLSPADGQLLYLRGRNVSRDMSTILPDFAITEVEAYHAAPVSTAPVTVADALSARAIRVAAFFSPRTASIFCEALTTQMRAGLGDTVAVAISDRAGEKLNQMGFQRVVVSERPDGAAMRAAICGACGIAPPQDRVCD